MGLKEPDREVKQQCKQQNVNQRAAELICEPTPNRNRRRFRQNVTTMLAEALLSFNSRKTKLRVQRRGGFRCTFCERERGHGLIATFNTPSARSAKSLQPSPMFSSENRWVSSDVRSTRRVRTT